MKKNITYLLLVVIIPFLLILTVNFLKQNHEKNGFTRKIIKGEMSIIKVFKLNSSFFYFAGISESAIYLKNIKDTDSLFSIDYSLDLMSGLDLKFIKKLSPNVGMLNMGVIDDIAYVTNNNSGDLGIISISNGEKHNFRYQKIYLDQSHLISKESIVGRQMYIESNEMQRRITKINYLKDTIDKTFVIKKGIDGFFSTDGMLQYDAQKHVFFYMYFYHGEIICLDTNLNRTYSIKTIDTIRTAKINALKLNNTQNGYSETILTQSTPPRIVNKNFTLGGNKLYMVSTLKSDNENFSDFRKNQIIDVYNTDKGEYIYSFYIPKYKHKKLQEFRIYKGFVYAIFDEFIVKYKAE